MERLEVCRGFRLPETIPDSGDRTSALAQPVRTTAYRYLHICKEENTDVYPAGLDGCRSVGSLLCIPWVVVVVKMINADDQTMTRLRCAVELAARRLKPVVYIFP